MQTYPAALLIKYVIASVFAFDRDEFDAFQNLEPLDAIDKFYDEALVAEFGQNFNSPGKYSVITKRAAMAGLLAAGLFVATSTADADFEHVRTEAASAVKGAMQGAEKGERANEVDEFVDSMRATNWNKVKATLGKPATDKMKISLSNKVEVANHRKELDDK